MSIVMRLFSLLLSTTLLLNPARGQDVVLFRESFDNPDLAKRGWYDIIAIRLAAEAQAGKSCIEYEWTGPDAKVSGSSAMRRGFEPTDELFIRYYLKFSKGWGWSGRNYHPHLTHFMTTENGAWHGPAASHLTLYIEPVNGRLRLAAQDIQNKDAPHGLTQGPIKGGYNGRFYDSAETLFKDEQWHCVEAQFKLNTLDLKADKPNADGDRARLVRWQARHRPHRRDPALDGFPQHEVQPVPHGALLRPRPAAACAEVVDR